MFLYKHRDAALSDDWCGKEKKGVEMLRVMWVKVKQKVKRISAMLHTQRGVLFQ